MNRLVALDLPGGPEFVDQLRRIWDDGDAAFPVDQRLPDLTKQSLLDRFRVGQPVEPGDALVVATSGATGEPKGVVLTHDAVSASAEATSDRLDVTDQDHWLACLPLSHVGGLSVVTRALLTATPLTVLPGFDADMVNSIDATLVSLVPTALRRVDPTRFRTIVLGGSRPPVDRPANTVTTYGMTETGSGVVYDRRPLDGVEVRIVDGEIHLRGAMLLRCYRDGSDPKVDGWFATGDLGEIGDNGLLTVHGRFDDLIITGGENVWPEAVESVLRSHPGIADVAVVGEPDPEWGEIVSAYIVPVDSHSPPSLLEVRRYAKRRLPSYSVPRRVTNVDVIPRTALGKMQRLNLIRRTE